VRSIVNTLGVMVTAIACAMLLPLAVALCCREWEPALDFLVSFGATLTLGGAMRLSRPRARGLTRKRALVVTGLAWVAAALVSAVPFVLGGYYASPFDAFFDTVSCYTGTGMAMIQDVSHLPVSFGVWRMAMLAIGAQGIVLVALGFGTTGRFSGVGLLFEAEGHQDRLSPRMATTSRFIALFMGAFIALGTLLCTLICLVLCGMSPARALYHGFCLAVAGATTGGVSVMDVGVSYYHQPLLYLVLMCLMLSGTFSFALYLRMARKGVREFVRDIETRMILAWALVVLVLLAASFAQDGALGNLGTFLNKGVFNLVSAVTGTGFFTLTSAQLTVVASSAVLFSFILGMGMGGATSSTAGGFKAIRLAVVFKSIVSELRRVLLPQDARESVRYYHMGERTLTPELSRNAMLVVLLFLVTYIAGAMVGVLHGIDPLSATLESVSCTNNVGISAGIVGPGIAVSLKVVYLVQMLAGRLEFIALFATFAAIGVSLARSAGDSKAGRLAASAVPQSVRSAWRGRPSSRGGR
jgi:trk system potassium uptake protein TrkH